MISPTGGNLQKNLTPSPKSEDTFGVRGPTATNTEAQERVSLFEQKLGIYPSYSEGLNDVTHLAKDALSLIDSDEDHLENLSKLKKTPGFTIGVFRHLNTINGRSDANQEDTFNKLLPYLNLKEETPENVTPSKKAIESLIEWKCPQGVVNAFVEAINKNIELQDYYKAFSENQKNSIKEKIQVNNILDSTLNYTSLETALGIS